MLRAEIVREVLGQCSTATYDAEPRRAALHATQRLVAMGYALLLQM
jgi:hypothetical protein